MAKSGGTGSEVDDSQIPEELPYWVQARVCATSGSEKKKVVLFCHTPAGICHHLLDLGHSNFGLRLNLKVIIIFISSMVKDVEHF